MIGIKDFSMCTIYKYVYRLYTNIIPNLEVGIVHIKTGILTALLQSIKKQRKSAMEHKTTYDDEWVNIAKKVWSPKFGRKETKQRH